jgi:microcystin-dependent protein
MADPFVAEVRIFGFQFAPKGWAFCNGQIMPISQNTALFSLLGTTYGGDGKSTFALPDLQGRAALHPGQGPGLSLYDLGQEGGEEAVTLLQSEMPSHPHTVGGALAANGTSQDPTGNIWAQAELGPRASVNAYAPAASINGKVNPNILAVGNPPIPTVAGGGLPHNNLMPYLTLNFCIALQGVFPPRT